jgi:hypothetical protein
MLIPDIDGRTKVHGLKFHQGPADGMWMNSQQTEPSEEIEIQGQRYKLVDVSACYHATGVVEGEKGEAISLKREQKKGRDLAEVVSKCCGPELSEARFLATGEKNGIGLTFHYEQEKRKNNDKTQSLPSVRAPVDSMEGKWILPILSAIGRRLLWCLRLLHPLPVREA